MVKKTGYFNCLNQNCKNYNQFNFIQIEFVICSVIANPNILNDMPHCYVCDSEMIPAS